MTRRAATIQGLLALAGLVAAYLTWQREPSLESGQAYVLDITKSELQTVRYEELDRVAPSKAPDDKTATPPPEVKVRDWVELSSTTLDDGRAVWVRLAGRGGASVDLPSGHPVVQTAIPERTVRGNDGADKLWTLFAPLKASRALGVLDADKLKDLGLAEPKKRVTVTYKGITKTFDLAPPPPGGTEPYVRDVEDGQVYIVARQILTDFQAARSNLVERKLHAFALQDIDKLVITANGKKKEFQFRRFENRPGGDLLPAETPEKPDQTAGNWHDRVFALFPADVLGKDEKPASGEPTVVVRVEYFYRGKPLGHLDLARVGASSAGSEGSTPTGEVLARSEYSAGWMTLAVDAQALVAEGESLFGGS